MYILYSSTYNYLKPNGFCFDKTYKLLTTFHINYDVNNLAEEFKLIRQYKYVPVPINPSS